MGRLREMVTRAARGKRRSPQVARFLLDEDTELLHLRTELAAQTYEPGPVRPMWIQDPKRRLISVIPFRDRVVQHLLIDTTLQAIERRMAPQSHACRKGHGTHRALREAMGWTRARRWVLKVDIRKFFPSIDHELLRRRLHSVTPVSWRWLSDRFIDAPYEGEQVHLWFPGDTLWTPVERPHGLAIGSLTSQIWANFYVSALDHLLAAGLGIGSFVRYCDDWLVWHDDPQVLRNALAQMQQAAQRLRLRLHPSKTRLYRTTDPVSFVGFVLRRRGDGVIVHLRKDSLRRFRQRVRLMRSLFQAGAIEASEVRSRVQAWLAHARHGHTRRLVEAVMEDIVF